MGVLLAQCLLVGRVPGEARFWRQLRGRRWARAPSSLPVGCVSRFAGVTCETGTAPLVPSRENDLTAHCVRGIG